MYFPTRNGLAVFKGRDINQLKELLGRRTEPGAVATVTENTTHVKTVQHRHYLYVFSSRMKQRTLLRFYYKIRPDGKSAA